MIVFIMILLIAIVVYFAFKIDALELKLFQANIMLELKSRQLKKFGEVNARLHKELSSITGENS